MKDLRRLLIAVPAVVLVALLIMLFVSRGTMEQLAFLRRGGESTELVDQRPFQTAQTLAGLAVSSEEQRFAQEAERLADHEVDQAFATALRQASTRQRVLAGAAGESAKKVAAMQATVADDKARVAALTDAGKQAGLAAAAGDDLDVAQAQLGLDTNELADATADLARQSGDQRGQIEEELAAFQTASKKGEGAKETAVVAAKRYSALWGRVSAWLDQRTRVQLLEQARLKVADDAKEFAKQHDVVEQKNASAAPRVAAMTGSARVKGLESMAGQRMVMSLLDDRQQTDEQLAAVYGRWEQQVWMQHRIVRYLILQSLAAMAAIVLVAAVLIVLVRRNIGRIVTESRRAGTMETIATLGLELLAAMGLLFVLLGVPQQAPTILGLAGAGLTVVFQDFILGFFGWFVLMGRNGIRVCDWVEVNGVGGEVSEIGLFRTTLLETGNWTSRGHPTGRKVTMINSFAIRGQYFNFSTHGQWMWDEIKLTVGSGPAAYAMLGKLQAAVDHETASDTESAEREWRQAAGSVVLRDFGAKPTVDLRPGSGAGMDVVVRFVTRAAERFERRNRLYEAMIGLLRETEAAAALPAESTAA